MWPYFFEANTLNRGERASVFAYSSVLAMSAGLSFLVMSGAGNSPLQPGDQSWFSYWVIIAGAISGVIALALGRGWLGHGGTLGILRACVGSFAIAFFAAMVAGFLIHPLLGVVYGPVLLMTKFIETPWVALAWFAVAMGVHALLMVANREFSAVGGPDWAVSPLSRLPQENPYYSTYRGWR